MRKILGFVLIMAMAGILVGCETTTPEIKNAQPNGLTIQGTVYGDTQSGDKGYPLEGVVIFLSGARDSWATTSDSKGEYRFTGLPVNAAVDGNENPLGYDIVATKEGYQRTFVYRLNFGTSINPPDNSVLNYDIRMDPRPIVISITPAPGTTIDTASSYEVEFNEAMDISSVRPSFTAQGARTFAIGDTSSITTSWSSDNKTLTITPTADLLPNMEYRLQVDPSDIARDASGNDLAADAGEAGGIDSTIYNSTSSLYYYRTPSEGVPGAPSGLIIIVNATDEVDYIDVANPANPVFLVWQAPTSGNISGYRVYVATSTTGAWSLLDEASGLALATTVGDVNTALYGSTYGVGLGKFAFVTDTVYFKVVAFNGEGEGPGVIEGERDSVAPKVLEALWTLSIPGFTDYYQSASGCYILFSEPMDLSLLSDEGNYSVTTLGPPREVTSAKVILSALPFTVVELTFSGWVTTGDTVTVPSGAKDLSGNTVDPLNATADIP